MSDTLERRVRVEQEGPVLRIGLDRPGKRNAADRALLRGLAAASTRLEQDDTVRVVIDALPGALAALAATDDAAEGLRALRDRRDPVWTGR